MQWARRCGWGGWGAGTGERGWGTEGGPVGPARWAVDRGAVGQARWHLLVSVDDAARVDELGGSKQLVEDVALVHVLQQRALADDGVQIRVWGAPRQQWGLG